MVSEGDKDGLHDLPQSWAWTRLDEIGAVASGGTPSTKEASNFDGSIPWVTPADLSDYSGKFIAEGRRGISKKGLTSSSALLLPAGTVLFSSRAPVGYVVIAQNPIATNQGFKNLTPHDGVFNEYIYYYLKASKRLAESYASGTTFLEISGRRFGRLPVPLAPLPEQHRIVAKIEELLTKLDAGVAALNAVQTNLKRYRQTVLDAAVRGVLTKGWRRRNKTEPAERTLEATLRLQHRKREPIKPNAVELPQVPSGWTWATVDQLAAAEQNSITDGPFGSNLKTSHYTASGPRVIRLQNVGDGFYIDEEAHISEAHFATLQKHRIFAGDLVVASLGKNPPRACLVPDNLGPTIVKADCIRFKPEPTITLARYVTYALNSYSTRRRTEKAVHGVGRPRLNLTNLRSVALPLPPKSEQEQIVNEVERLFSIADAVEEAAEKSLKEAERLRQSILKRAFEGKLVPQDPTDEPAEKLLERIKAGKVRMGESRQTKQSRKKGSNDEDCCTRNLQGVRIAKESND